MRNRRKDEKKKDFFDEEESWKEKIEDKAESVADEIKDELQLTQTEKNIKDFHKERNENRASVFNTNTDFDSAFESDKSVKEEKEDEWKEEIDLPTFIVLSVEIVLVTYFILAVLGYVPFF